MGIMLEKASIRLAGINKGYITVRIKIWRVLTSSTMYTPDFEPRTWKPIAISVMIFMESLDASEVSTRVFTAGVFSICFGIYKDESYCRKTIVLVLSYGLMCSSAPFIIMISLSCSKPFDNSNGCVKLTCMFIEYSLKSISSHVRSLLSFLDPSEDPKTLIYMVLLLIVEWSKSVFTFSEN